uniref:Uncharacterized protein n=1 Tax=Pseudomonas phage HRDY3 TaxID=3236930 RepID=A0AB39CE38_9VIRU
MASAHAESYRSGHRQTVARESLGDKDETPANVLRAKATMMEDGARALITRPAYIAAQIELDLIEHILSLVDFDKSAVPYVFHAVQRDENNLALCWKAFVEQKAFSAMSFDTHSEILSRGITLPDFSQTQTRDEFLKLFTSTSHWPVLLNHHLQTFYKHAMVRLKGDHAGLLGLYKEALADAEKSPAFLGCIPQGGTPLPAAEGTQRLGSSLPSGPA